MTGKLLKWLFPNKTEKIKAELNDLIKEAAKDINPQGKQRVEARLRELVENHPQEAMQAYQEFENRWAASYSESLSKPGTVNLSQAAITIRKKLGWPETGSVRGLPGANENLAAIMDEIEFKCGMVTFAEAVKFMAVLDPKGPEAEYVRYRLRKGLPAL